MSKHIEKPHYDASNAIVRPSDLIPYFGRRNYEKRNENAPDCHRPVIDTTLEIMETNERIYLALGLTVAVPLVYIGLEHLLRYFK